MAMVPALTAFYRPPPTQETGKYEPYVFPATADKIAAHTLPNIKALLFEMLTLGNRVLELRRETPKL